MATKSLTETKMSAVVEADKVLKKHKYTMAKYQKLAENNKNSSSPFDGEELVELQVWKKFEDVYHDLNDALVGLYTYQEIKPHHKLEKQLQLLEAKREILQWQNEFQRKYWEKTTPKVEPPSGKLEVEAKYRQKVSKLLKYWENHQKEEQSEAAGSFLEVPVKVISMR